MRERVALQAEFAGWSVARGLRGLFLRQGKAPFALSSDPTKQRAISFLCALCALCGSFDRL